MKSEENLDSFDRQSRGIQSKWPKMKRDIKELQEWSPVSFINELESVGKLVAFKTCVEEHSFWHGGNVKRDLESLQHFRGTAASNLQVIRVPSGFKTIYAHHAADIEPYLHNAPMEVVNSLDRRGDLIRVKLNISNENSKLAINLCDEIVDLWLSNMKNDLDLGTQVEKEIKEKYQKLVGTITDS